MKQRMYTNQQWFKKDQTDSLQLIFNNLFLLEEFVFKKLYKANVLILIVVTSQNIFLAGFSLP